MAAARRSSSSLALLLLALICGAHAQHAVAATAQHGSSTLQGGSSSSSSRRLLQGKAPAVPLTAARQQQQPPQQRNERGQQVDPVADAAAARPTVIFVPQQGSSSSSSRQAGDVVVIPISTQQQAATGAVPILTTQTRQPGAGATETLTQTQVLVAPAGPVSVPLPVGDNTVSQVVIVQGEPGGAVTIVPTRPQAAAPAQAPEDAIDAQQRGPYCIPRTAAGLAVLAAGDSITQGSVPSKNLNHPYTIRMRQVLEAQLQTPVRAVDAGLGGGGVFMTGFNVPTTFGPWLDSQMAIGPWNVAVIMIGINDLLRGGRSADDIMAGLKPMVAKVLASNTPVILMPPFAAPGFVQESDSKEGERRKLAQLFSAYASEHTARTGGIGPQVWMLDLQASPFDFYPMSPAERSKWLDDGLHMTEAAYDAVGDLVAKEILSHMCQPPAQSN